MIFESMYKKISVFIFIFILFNISCLVAGNPLKNHIKHNEGLRLKLYQDPGRNKNLLIGYGHNLSSGITIEVAEYLLESDIKYAQNFLKNYFSDYDNFSQNRQIALTDMVYCMRPTTFLTFKKMIRAIRRDDWKKAALEIRNSIRHRHFTSRALRNMDLFLE